MRGIQCEGNSVVDFEDGGIPMEREQVWSLRAERGPFGDSHQRKRASVLQLQEMNSVDIHVSLEA